MAPIKDNGMAKNATASDRLPTTAVEPLTGVMSTGMMNTVWSSTYTRDVSDPTMLLTQPVAPQRSDESSLPGHAGAFEGSGCQTQPDPTKGQLLNVAVASLVVGSLSLIVTHGPKIIKAIRKKLWKKPVSARRPSATAEQADQSIGAPRPMVSERPAGPPAGSVNHAEQREFASFTRLVPHEDEGVEAAEEMQRARTI